MHSVVAGNGSASDWPFRVTALEDDIITLDPSPHASILLLGRSGTGKVRDERDRTPACMPGQLPLFSFEATWT